MSEFPEILTMLLSVESLKNMQNILKKKMKNLYIVNTKKYM